jgi:hypothetical protein
LDAGWPWPCRKGSGASKRTTGVKYEDVAGIDHIKGDIQVSEPFSSFWQGLFGKLQLQGGASMVGRPVVVG